MFIRRDLAELHQNGVRVRVIGQADNLPADIADLLNEAETLTRDNTAQTLIVAFNYGSRSEIVSAVQDSPAELPRANCGPIRYRKRCISESLDTVGIPDPDLILRTAGEFRLSNFLMWQAAYSEFVFDKKLLARFYRART